MSYSSMNNEEDLDFSYSDLPLPEGEDNNPNHKEDQNWLTLRRRCELCKQRKVWAKTHRVLFVNFYGTKLPNTRPAITG